MNLNDINFLVSFVLEEKAPALSLTPNKFERLLHLSQLKHFKRKVGLPEEYQPGQPVNTQGFEITKVNTQDLSPFKVIMGDKTPYLVVDNEGYAVIPSDMYYPSTLRHRLVQNGVEKWRKVDILTDKEYDDRVSSSLLKPSLRYPIANFQNGMIRFEPRPLQYVFFTYLRLPVEPVYATTRLRGFEEYDAANSVELEWNDVNIIDIISILLGELGVKISNAELFQIAEKQKIKGI